MESEWEVIKTFDEHHPWRKNMDTMQQAIEDDIPEMAVFQVKKMAVLAVSSGFDSVQWKLFIDSWDRKLMETVDPAQFKAYRDALTRGRGMSLSPAEREYAGG